VISREIDRIDTATHTFCISLYEGRYYVLYQAINQQTGKPWQASHRVTHGADIMPAQIAFSTEALARAAVTKQISAFIKRSRS
jgi:hypothetical protein